MLDQSGWAPQAVFCGSDKGALASILALAKHLRVAHLVNYCGFVGSDEIPYLYAGALALVMPTYFGPNNIPPMEAMSLGVPVCYSEFSAFKEVMGDSVYYINLEDPASLASALASIRAKGQRLRKLTNLSSERCDDAASGRYMSTLWEVITQYMIHTGAACSKGADGRPVGILRSQTNCE